MNGLRMLSAVLAATGALAAGASVRAQDDENPHTPGAIPDPGTYQGSTELQRQQDQQDQQNRQQQQNAQQPYQPPGPTGYSQTYRPASGAAAAGGTSGSWEIYVNCPGGGAVREPDAVFHHGRYVRRFDGGDTNLAMTLLSPSRIHVRGVITFDNGDVDAVDAIGSGTGELFTGRAQYGKRTGCPFTAIRH